MRIVIAQRLHPFSHSAGASIVIPGSTYEIQVYPALLILRDLSTLVPTVVEEISVGVKGPVEDFTALLDLEKGLVRVWGKASDGFFRYHLKALQDGFIGLFLEKSPSSGLQFSSASRIKIFKDKTEQPTLLPLPKVDQLALGNHKAQDWDLVTRRLDLTEILPSWYRLGQLVPDLPKIEHNAGTAHLLQKCEEAIISKTTLQLVPLFKNAFMGCFHGILSPRLQDMKHQGFTLAALKANGKGSALALLTEGSRLIRAMFLQATNDQLDVLPALPPEFHCGRMTQAHWNGIGLVDLEWSKKSLRRMVLHAEVTKDVEVRFQQDLKKYRLRETEQDHGKILSCGSVIKIEAGRHYLFDNFQH